MFAFPDVIENGLKTAHFAHFTVAMDASCLDHFNQRTRDIFFPASASAQDLLSRWKSISNQSSDFGKL